MRATAHFPIDDKVPEPLHVAVGSPGLLVLLRLGDGSTVTGDGRWPGRNQKLRAGSPQTWGVLGPDSSTRCGTLTPTPLALPSSVDEGSGQGHLKGLGPGTAQRAAVRAGRGRGDLEPV